MAPCPPTGKKAALAQLARGVLPIRLGSPHSFVAILAQDGMFRVRQLIADDAEVKAAAEAAFKKRQSFQPEHVEALAKPTGKIFLEASTREELYAALERYDWPADW